MPNNWITTTVQDLKIKPSTEAINYQLIYVQEWGDFAFYHPTYKEIYSDYDYITVDGVNYNNLRESFCIRPPDKIFDDPGRWLKVGDISLNSISPQGIVSGHGVEYMAKMPNIIPYKLGQRCNVIIREYFPEWAEVPNPDYQGYPLDLLLSWETIKVPAQEIVNTINPNNPQQVYSLTWWLTHKKPIISFNNPKGMFNYLEVGGLLWYKIDENRLFINSTNSLNSYERWSEITLDTGAV